MSWSKRRCAPPGRHGIDTVVLGGGVSANERLRQVLAARAGEHGVKCYVPRPAFSTDNAAMIALAGYHRFNESGPSPIDSDVYSRSSLG